MPDYKEVNPSIFGCVSFPFLFGVMYGDMGHGICLFFVSSMLVLFSDQIKKTSMRDIADVRYILWMMSFFAVFCGVCYNDFVSIPFDAGSCYTRAGPIAIRRDSDCVYAIGFDPVWVLSTNELTFSNSLKMKTSVIFGVVQMSLGIFMKAFNALYFRRYIDFIFEFLPQIILLWALFGWMDLLIIVKWLTPW